MRASQRISFALFIASFIGLGCSQKDAGLSFPGAGAGAKSQPKALPEMNGVWRSDCIESEWKNGTFRVIDLEIKGRKLNYKSTLFTNMDCSIESDSVTDLKGTMENQGRLNDGRNQVKFIIPLDTGYTWRNLLMKKSGDALQISEFYNNVGNVLDANAMIGLKLAGEVPTEPENPKEDPDDLGVLESGHYKPTLGSNSQLCEQVVSTMSTNDKLSMVYIDFLSPCRGQVQLSCEANFCTGGGSSLKVLSAVSYEFTNTNGVTEKFGQ